MSMLGLSIPGYRIPGALASITLRNSDILHYRKWSLHGPIFWILDYGLKVDIVCANAISRSANSYLRGGTFSVVLNYFVIILRFF